MCVRGELFRDAPSTYLVVREIEASKAFFIALIESSITIKLFVFVRSNAVVVVIFSDESWS